jgi:hypothetical protein
MTPTPHALTLPGLDAQDPLAWLAALGCLLGTTSHCQREGLPPPKLAFRTTGPLVPTLHGPFETLDALAHALARDLDECAGRVAGRPRDRLLAFGYDDDKGNRVHDLKPPPGDFRRLAQALIDDASRDDRRTVDWAAAVLTDVAVDNKGAGKPFALHFTAGQQRFLVVALELLDGADKDKKPRPGSPTRPVDADDLRLALAGPWPNDRKLKVFRWSPTQDRAYALRALDPSTDEKLGTPGADWLALRGLGMLASAPVGREIHTSGVGGAWKTGTFSYPLWCTPLDVDAARSLLRHPAMQGSAERAGTRAAARTLPRGVEVLTCRISRSEQGGYGAFSRPFRRG